jgi:hypothetical protein
MCVCACVDACVSGSECTCFCGGYLSSAKERESCKGAGILPRRQGILYLPDVRIVVENSLDAYCHWLVDEMGSVLPKG